MRYSLNESRLSLGRAFASHLGHCLSQSEVQHLTTLNNHDRPGLNHTFAQSCCLAQLLMNAIMTVILLSSVLHDNVAVRM